MSLLALLPTHANISSGLMLPGLNAIMGPTGSGKTTYVNFVCNLDSLLIIKYFILRLLDILADRKSSSRVKGSVVIDGVQKRNDFRFLSGYVVQVILLSLTLDVFSSIIIIYI